MRVVNEPFLSILRVTLEHPHEDVIAGLTRNLLVILPRRLYIGGAGLARHDIEGEKRLKNMNHPFPINKAYYDQLVFAGN